MVPIFYVTRRICTNFMERKKPMDFIIIPFHDYKKWHREGFRTRDAHLTRHFAGHPDVNRILVINRPVSLAQRLAGKEKKQTEVGSVLHEGSNWTLMEQADGICTLDIVLPDVLKVARMKKNWWFAAFSSPRTKAAILSALEVLHMQDAVLMIQNPMSIQAASYIPHSLFVFDAIDNWLHHPQMAGCSQIVEKNYDLVKKQADVIFTVSKSLQDFFAPHPHVYWVANGVDANDFAPARAGCKNARPCIGYVGKIQDRVDRTLVEACLQKMPEADFVFAGPIYASKKEWKALENKYPNLHLTGDIHYNKLPQAMARMDIAIIPHTVDAFTNSMNPLKLYEYLAAGKPVLTTPVAGSAQISPYVYTADTPEDFADKLQKLAAMAADQAFDPQAIAQSLPASCSWEAIACRILEYIQQVGKETHGE